MANGPRGIGAVFWTCWSSLLISVKLGWLNTLCAFQPSIILSITTFLFFLSPLSTYLHVCLAVSLSISPPIHPSIFLPLQLYIHPSVIPSQLCFPSCLFNSLSICQPAHLFLNLFIIHPSVYNFYLSLELSIHPSIHPSIDVYIYLRSICQSIYLSMYRSIYLSMCLSIYLSIYLSIHPLSREEDFSSTLLVLLSGWRKCMLLSITDRQEHNLNDANTHLLNHTVMHEVFYGLNEWWTEYIWKLNYSSRDGATLMHGA